MYDKTALLDEFDIDYLGFKIKDKNFYKNYVDLFAPYKKAIDL